MQSLIFFFTTDATTCGRKRTRYNMRGVSLVFKAFRWREVLFLDPNLKAEKMILKLIKSGQRNIKNFSENYKYV